MIEREQLRQIFRDRLDPDHDPLEFQYKTAEHLLAGHSVILQAPTGAGKTQAALLPFVAARERNIPFPRQMMHAAPMRVLVDSFYDKALQLGLNETLGIETRRQTGAAQDDPKLESDLIYLTIDQLLSSFLGIPFSLSNRQANVNMGAVIGAYLVIDEFHLLDPGTSLPTMIRMLSWLNGITPFLLMTATMSKSMLKRLAEEIGSGDSSSRAVKTVIVEEKDLEQIPSHAKKVRNFHVADSPLSAEAVLAKHNGRSIVVCNRVVRAQKIYRDLLATGQRTEANTILLHARFLTKDRGAITKRLIMECGKDAWGTEQEHDFIVVATQVIEVGLDISCNVLHTDLAPANAVLQRAGRCARFANQHGDVYVYPLPLNEKGEVDYSPYLDSPILKQLCDHTLEAISNEYNGNLNFRRERDLVDAVHAPADTKMMDRLSSDAGHIGMMLEAMRNAAAKYAPKLIRDIDSFSVIVHENPERDKEVLTCETFSITHGRARRLLAQASAAPDYDWCFRYYIEDTKGQESEANVSSRWSVVTKADQLFTPPILVLNPQYATYSHTIGLELHSDGKAPIWRTPYKNAGAKSAWSPRSTRLETYFEHISRIIDVFQQVHAESLTHLATKVEHKLEYLPGTLMLLTRLILVLHDIGKLTVKWQAEALSWQQRIKEEHLVPNNATLAHTHSDESIPLHKHTARANVPHHAAEGAYLAKSIIEHALKAQGYDAYLSGELARAALTAIARHHSPSTINCISLPLHSRAAASIKEVLNMFVPELSLDEEVLEKLRLPDSQRDLNAEQIIISNTEVEIILYALVARVLRMSDQVATAGQ